MKNVFNSFDRVISDFNKAMDETFPERDSEGYELDEDGNRLSCCGDVLGEEMICLTCKEHN